MDMFRFFRRFYARRSYQRFEDQLRHQEAQYKGHQRKVPLWKPVGAMMLTGGGYYYYSHLEDVPFTGRSRFMVRSADMQKMMAQVSRDQMLREVGSHILPPTHPESIFVKNVVAKLLRTLKNTPDLASLPIPKHTEVYVVDSPVANAVVLPGGEIFVFRGILAPARNADGLASVLSHELAHVLLEHPGERMSSATFLSYGLFIFQALTGGDFVARMLANLFLELALVLPNSRKTEQEADYLGLMLMASACYQPQEAAAFWKRMQEMDKAHVPAFLSTHPSHVTRADLIKEWLPDALSRREEAGCDDASFWSHIL